MGDARDTAILILAAGQGTRMKSRRAKVLHELCGRPLLGYPLALAESQDPARTFVVVGRDAEEVQQAFTGRAEFVLQAEQRGTGHAVLQAQPKLRDFEGDLLILYADVPLLRDESIARMRQLKEESGAGLVMLSSPEPLPGLVVRDAAGQVQRILERTDASPEELATLREGNTGVYLADADLVWEALSRVDDQNEQGEIYLTDIVEFAVTEGRGVEALLLEDANDCLGVNTRGELAAAAAVLRGRICQQLMTEGVTIVDPEHTYIDVGVRIGRDSLIEPGCVIQGETVLGEGVHVKPHCHIESSRLDADVVIGPSAHLRPGTHLGRGVRIGNFVEVKNSDLGPGVKADHLSYIGDADVAAGASFGCGAITVNYDWEAKHRTRVGEGANVGCNANLIAPVEVGAHSAVAAGSTVTGDIPEGALAVGRARQRNIEGWVSRRSRKKNKRES
ncbi:MAG: bifunctional UDP-N-acetylglucosamine diphosphorylase/glucosamine-1-phosphate N-acetyltransferase GlmU [Proteobacteria bacterium]|nr:bifunctional UDP-N-acetylglucosamine diphosphorylase/glucosamine-1-phosphate N-acetyltransferase GlmU [Pseudomonadota bacterium]